MVVGGGVPSLARRSIEFCCSPKPIIVVVSVLIGAGVATWRITVPTSWHALPERVARMEQQKLPRGDRSREIPSAHRGVGMQCGERSRRGGEGGGEIAARAEDRPRDVSSGECGRM